MQNQFFKSRLRSFANAFSGWWHVIRTQQNAWIHALMTVLVVVLGVYLNITRTEWILVVVMVALVWAAEFFNTALEVVVDLATQEHHPLAKVAKDVGAAAVLISAGAALIVGLLIFGQRLLDALSALLI